MFQCRFPSHFKCTQFCRADFGPRHFRLAADRHERLAELLRREDTLAGLLHRQRLLGASRLLRLARTLLHRLA